MQISTNTLIPAQSSPAIQNHKQQKSKLNSEVQPSVTVDLPEKVNGYYQGFVTRESVGDEEWARILMGSSYTDPWAEQGLDVSDQQWSQVADDLEKAMIKHGRLSESIENLKKHSLSLNRHQMMINAGVDAPDWFLLEYAESLEALDRDAPEVAKAFRNGALHYSNIETETYRQAKLYQDISLMR